MARAAVVGGIGSLAARAGGDEDIYGGFMDGDHAAGGTGAGFGAPGQPLGNIRGMGAAPPSGIGRMPTGARMATGAAAGGGGDARPMTSVQGAGFSSKVGGGKFNPMGAAGAAGGPPPPLEEKEDASPTAKAKTMERRVHELIESAALAQTKGEAVMALERAREAGRKERQLTKYRDQHKLRDQVNLDLTFSVCFCLAQAYAMNDMHDEALQSFGLVARNKHYRMSGRMRVNMGNLHFRLKQFTQAIKQFRIGLDLVKDDHKKLRASILRNIGCAFVRMGQFQDAIRNFDEALQASTATAAVADVNKYDDDFQCAFNLIVCYYALGDRELMKRSFQRLVELQPPGPAKNEDDEDEDDEDEAPGRTPKDELFEYENKRRDTAVRYISRASMLLAPRLFEDSWVQGYEWVALQLKDDYPQVASELEIARALAHLRARQFDRAIELLRAFEKRETALRAKAATNLAFLYYLEAEHELAHRYASLAVKHQRYNAKALVNMGCCLCERNELMKARELFLEAIGVEADCAEAIFNLGLVHKQVGSLGEALQAFDKLHTIVPSSPEVLYHIANIYDMLGQYPSAARYFSLLLTKVPTDPNALARLGQIHSKEGDEAQAFHYHLESYRHFPVDLDVIRNLGVWFVNTEVYWKAIRYFRQAAAVAPKDVKWRLMIASCYRRMDANAEALETYKQVHRDFPDDIECLEYLVMLCRDMGREASEFEERLLRLQQRRAAMGDDEDEESGAYDGHDDMDDDGHHGGGISSPSRGGGGGRVQGMGDAGGYIPAADESYDEQSTSRGGSGGVGSAQGKGGGRGSGAAASPARFSAPGESAAVVQQRSPGGARDDDFGDEDLSGLLDD